MAFLEPACDDPCMPIWLEILLGLIILLSGAELLVRGSVGLAKTMGIRPILVGLTVVAFGTSAPELVVSLTAAVREGSADMALGNIYGSNLANIGLILAITILIRPMLSITDGLRFEVGWLLAATGIGMLLAADGAYGQWDGMLLVGLLLGFSWWAFYREKQVSRQKAEQRDTLSLRALPAQIVMVILGLLGLVYGGEFLVSGAVRLAKDLGMSEGLIGATVGAIGTSLPELAASAMAALRGQPQMALGNIVGSNIFNLFMVMGMTSIVTPLAMDWNEHGLRVYAGLALSLILAFMLLKNLRMGRGLGSLMLAVYLGYLTWEVYKLNP